MMSATVREQRHRIPILEWVRGTGSRAGRLMRRLVRRGGVPLPKFEVFAALKRDGFQPVPLWTPYRDFVKRRWRGYFWPVSVLLELNQRGLVSRSLGALAADILKARTLPHPPGEIAEAVRPEAERLKDDVRSSDLRDRFTGQTVFTVVPTSRQVRQTAELYRSSAKGMLDELGELGFAAPGLRALEVGCGSGYKTYALGTLGAAESVGVDTELEPDHGFSIAQRPAVAAYYETLAPDLRSTVRLERRDGRSLPYEEGRFDLVHSASSLEHVRTPAHAFTEMHRVLRPGGFAYHEVDPWFSPQGGHSMCNLDFPWGHVRLSEMEFEDYLRRYRPHEYGHAMEYYRNDFQRPRLTVGQLRALAVESGFQVVGEYRVTAGFENHRRLVTRHLTSELKASGVLVSKRDLLTYQYRLILRKE